MSSSVPSVVKSRGWRMRCPRAATTAARQWVRAALFTLVAVGTRVCSGQGVLTAELVAQLRQACDQCDATFLSYVQTYQSTFYAIGGAGLSPLEAGNRHCSRFAEVAQCYQDCLQGYAISYSPRWKQSFNFFYAQFCDPVCRLSFLPGCYNDLGLPYGLFRSGCDEDALQLNRGIVQCIDLWTSKQNCTGVCTSGQRALSSLRLSLESICRLPSWEYDCPTALELCIDQSYGFYGGNFVRGTLLIDEIGNTSCSAYRGTYLDCVTKAVAGHLSFGTPPYTIDFNQACGTHSDVVVSLISLSDAATKQLCDHPELTFTEICSPRPVTTAAPTVAVTQTVTEPASSTTKLPKRVCKKRQP